MVLDIARKAHRVPRRVAERAPDLLGVLADDGEAGVDLGEALVAEGVGAGQVGGDVGVGCGEVGEEGLCEAGVACVGVFEGLGAVGIGFEEGDGVGDDGVGGEVLSICVRYLGIKSIDRVMVVVGSAYVEKVGMDLLAVDHWFTHSVRGSVGHEEEDDEEGESRMSRRVEEEEQ